MKRRKLSTGYVGKARKIKPRSRPTTLWKLDGRTKEAKFLRQTRAELAEHLDHPTAMQRMLIEQAAMLLLRVRLMDRRFAEQGCISDADITYYLSWANSLTRILRRLGLEAAEASHAPRLSDYVSSSQRRRRVLLPHYASPP